MKGYLVVTVLALAVVLLTPLLTLSATVDGTTPPTADRSEDTAPSTDSEPVFKVKNAETGEVTTFSEEEFLIGILSCEMAPSSPPEALKAQAVAAYTYYCRQRSAAADGVFSNVPDTLFTTGTTAGLKERFGDQFDKWYGVLKDTVQAVKGERVLYNGEPITACYHAISAGLTEDAATVWGGNYPYLKPVDSSGDLAADGFETTVALTPDEVAEKLEAQNAAFTPSDKPTDWFQNPLTTDSGFVKTVTVCGTDFAGTALRTALSLRSACFTVEYQEDKFVFTVRGYGHNVGMSQAGAKYMATLGADYREILTHYYPGTVVA